MFESLAPVFACMVAFSVPLAIVLTKHQQKMATILQNRPQLPQPEALERSVQDLTYLAHQQSIAIQTLTESVNRLERQQALPTVTTNRS